MVTITGTTGLGRNIRAIGLDFSKGSVLVPKNTTLAARDIGLAAAGDHPTLRVRMKPRVAILSTGDELALPGQKRRVDQIVSSNSFALSAFATSCGAEVNDLGTIRDNLAATTAAVKRASSADILVTTGGASVGDHDFVQQALRDAGVKIDFWKIAMRPGKPFMFGTKGRLRVLGLPGNPVAALVCAQLFLRPLIAKMLGIAPISAPTHARAGAVLAANDQRQDYLRARLTHAADGGLVATPFSIQDSSMQRTMREANCLIVRAPFADVAEIGSLLHILLLSDGA